MSFLSKVRKYSIFVLSLMLALLILFLLNSNFIQSSSFVLKNKIKLEPTSDVKMDKQILEEVVLENEFAKSNLKKSDYLLVDNKGVDFCTKEGDEKIVGTYKNKKYDNLYITFIKNDGVWSICRQSTAP